MGKYYIETRNFNVVILLYAKIKYFPHFILVNEINFPFHMFQPISYVLKWCNFTRKLPQFILVFINLSFQKFLFKLTDKLLNKIMNIKCQNTFLHNTLLLNYCITI